MNDFKNLLLDSLPFHEDDIFDAPAGESPPARAKRAIDIIVGRGVTDTRGLIEIVKNTDESDFLRGEAIAFLRLLEITNALEPLVLIAYSDSESIPIRRSAIVTIYALRPENTFEIMRPLLLNDPLEDIRYSVVLGFSVYPEKRLFDLLKTTVFSDRSSKVRGEAIRQIGVYSSDADKNEVFEILVRKLQEPGEETTVKAYAMEGFAHLLDSRGLDIVLSYLSNPAPEIRLMAVYSLGHLGDARHLPRLEQMRGDPEVFVNFGTVEEEVEEAIHRIEERE